MPRIPESAVTVSVPGVSRQPIREAAEIGDAVVGLTEASTELASRLAEAERAEELTRMTATMEGSLADLQLEIAQNPEYNTVAAAEQALVEGAGRIREEIGESSSDVVNRAFERRFLQSSLRARIHAKQVGFKRQADASIANLDFAAEEFRRAYTVAPDDEKREEIRAQYAQSVNLSAYLSEQEKGDRIRNFNSDADNTRIETLINGDEAELALSLLRDNDALPGMDPLTRERFEEKALGKIRGDMEAELDIRISRGESTEAEIRDFRKRNIITSSAMSIKIRTLDRVNAELRASEAGVFRVASAITGASFPLDPKDKDDKAGLETFYQSVVVPQLEGLSDTQRSDGIVDFVTHSGIGMLPKSLQSEIRGKLRSGGDSDVVNASDMVDRILSSTPRALDDLAVEDIRLGLNVAKQIRAGISPPKAVSRAKEVEQIPEAATRVLKDRFRDLDTRLMIEDRINDIADPGIFTFERNIPAQFEGELIDLAEIEFSLNGGDIELALDVAQLQMNRVWSVTAVDGGPTRMMKYAPEAVYPQFTDSEALREQLLADVNENVIPELSIDRIRLVADLETARRSPPDYVVEVLQDDNEWIPMTDGGRLRRFHFDFLSSPEGKRQMAETEEILSSAKNRRIAVEAARERWNRSGLLPTEVGE